MAVNAVIGALRVNLGMNSAEFTDGVKRVNRSVDGIQRRMASAARVAAAAFAGVSAAATAAFMKVSAHADKMTKSAQKIGIPVEELSTLAHAADLSGVSFANLETGVGRLSQNILDSLQGASTEGSRALDSLGVALKNTDGSTRSTSEIIGDLAERFRQMPDGPEKTAIAMRVFGRSGRDLIPMLNQGRAGIQQMTEEARRLGLEISEKTGRSAERFNDNLTRVKRAAQGVAQAVFAKVIPAVASLSDRFVQNISEGGTLKSVVDVLAGAFNGMVRAIVFVVENLSTLYDLFKVFVAAKIVTFLASAAGTFLTLARAIRMTGLTLGVFALAQRAGIKGIMMIAGVVAIATGQFERLEGALASLWDRVDELMPKGIGENIKSMFGGDIETVTNEAADSLSIYTRAADNARQSFKPLATSTSALGSAIAGAADKTEDAWRGLRRVTEVAEHQFSPVVDQMKSTFSSWIDSAIEGTFRLQDALLDLAKQAAKMAANKVLTSVLAGLFGVPMTGFALPAFANGGSFNVGGAGGIDSQIIAFRASPNESVHITKPGQMIGGSTGGQVEILLSPELEGRILKQAEGQSIRITRQAAPGIAGQGAARAREDYARRGGWSSL